MTASSSSGVYPPPGTLEVFLQSILRSGLLDRAQLQAALQAATSAQRTDADALAEYLIRTGKLSRFQARKLLKGQAVGLVLGHFQVLAPIGRGSSGTVYLARDGRSGQLVALKVLPPRRAQSEERLRARFLREMTMSQQVAHPHLAWTFEAGECHGVCYLAMEFLPGKNLARLISDEGPLPLPRAARLMAEVAAALEHVHNHGLIHRDLKPSNIMITPHDHAKVLDLGLALVQGEEVVDQRVVGGQGYVVGTMDYIAPEQTTNAAAVDRRADIYSLGCTLYHALSGRPPFPGGTTREKIQRHRAATPVTLRQLQPMLPRAFVAVVERMMAKKPQERYPSAAAVETELRAWAEQETEQPLDQPRDAAYVEAVATLQAVEASTDYSLTDLAVVQPETDNSRQRLWLFAWGVLGLLGLGGILLWLLW